LIGPSGGRDPNPPRTASRLLKAIFQHMDENRIEQAWVADRMGMHRNRMTEYRKGAVTPGVIMVEEMADLVGLDLYVEPRGKTDA